MAVTTLATSSKVKGQAWVRRGVRRSALLFGQLIWALGYAAAALILIGLWLAAMVVLGWRDAHKAAARRSDGRSA